MTKKIVCFLLAALLCIVSAACETSEPISDTPGTTDATEMTPADTTHPEETKQDAACFISVSINPQLELHVTEGLHVTEVVFKNDDAETAYAGIPLTNTPLIDCLFVVFDVAYDKGYLQNGSHMDISFETALDEQFITMLKDEVWMTLADFQQRKQVEITVSGSVTTADGNSVPLDYDGAPSGTDEGASESAEDHVVSESEDDGSWDESFKLVERDANGNVIKTVQENAEGRDITVLYTYDENNRLVSETVSQFDSLGRPSNYSKTYQYDEAGSVVSSFAIHEDGTTVETTYQNGQRHIQKSYNPNNGYTQTLTYENNILVSDITEMPDGKYEKWYYNESGAVVERYGFTQSGRPIHSVYNADGSYTSYITEEDGTITTQTTGANG